MGIALNNKRGVRLATRICDEPIPERGAAVSVLDDMDDVHFGINSDKFDGLLDMSNPMEADLQGLGPRILDIKNRGGRTAEDTWFQVKKNIPRQRGPSPNFETFYDNLNDNKPITKRTFPKGAHISGENVGGLSKYKAQATDKGTGNYAHKLQYGTRWSKTALEYALASGRGMIHFHLDDMGDLSVIFDKTGDYAYNVTSRELRYVWRNWARFQHHVKFYNGYTAANQAVEVDPPWEGLPPKWEPDSSTQKCTRCNADFGVFTWKHHCRKCGKIFCDNCSKKEVNLYVRGILPVRRPGNPLEKGKVRVCNPCFLLV